MDSILTQTQIGDSNTLALPEGLKDLMSDITREVLRAKPNDMYVFIADYLAAMLEARDALCIACRICHDVCDCSCLPELEEDLRNIGLYGEDLETAKNVVLKYFRMDEVNEGNLMMSLLRRTEVGVNMMPLIQSAVRRAFIRHHRYQLMMKKKTEANKIAERTVMLYKSLDFDEDYLDDIDKQNETMMSTSSREESESLDINYQYKGKRLSSACLAGSLIDLPKYIPYSIHRKSHYEEIDQEKTNKDTDCLYHHDDYANDEKTEIDRENIFKDRTALSNACSCEGYHTEEYVEEETSEGDIQSETNTVEEDIREELKELASACKEDEKCPTQMSKEKTKQELLKNEKDFDQLIIKHESYSGLKLVPHKPSQVSIPLEGTDSELLLHGGRAASIARVNVSNASIPTTTYKRNDKELVNLVASSLLNIPSVIAINNTRSESASDKLTESQSSSEKSKESLLMQDSKSDEFGKKGVSFSDVPKESITIEYTTHIHGGESDDEITRPSTSSGTINSE